MSASVDVADALGHEFSSLLSSFGPWGQTKLVLSRVSASVSVTKDTDQLRDALSSGETGTFCQAFQSKLIGLSAKHYGDGCMTSAIILSTLLSNSSVSSSFGGIKKRVDKLNAVNFLVHSVRTQEDNIARFFVNYHIWSIILNARDIRLVLCYAGGNSRGSTVISNVLYLLHRVW
jgi:hypothetical protein